MNTFELEHRLMPITSQMEVSGVRINISLLERTELRLISLKHDVAEKINSYSSKQININSNPQLSQLLFEELAIESKDSTLSKNGCFKVNKSHLAKLKDEHEVISLIIRYRKIVSLLKFCNQLGTINTKTKRLHATFNQLGTETGRYSSKKPNLQNIPNPELDKDEKDELKIIESQFRKMFIPRKGCMFVCADYSQVEMRIMAHFSNDPFLIAAYLDDSLDIHTLTASKIFDVEYSEVTGEQRKIAKSINFGLIYGKTAYGLAGDLTRITGEDYTVEQAQKFIDKYFDKLPKVKQCLDQFINQADATVHATTLYGRKRPIPKLASNKISERESGKRIAMNTPIQGTAADILKIAMIKCNEAIDQQGLKSRMILTVHDELLFEVPKDEVQIMEKLVKYEMENAVQLSVPLKVELKTGTNWAEVH